MYFYRPRVPARQDNRTLAAKIGLTWPAGCAMMAVVDCEIPLADLRKK